MFINHTNHPAEHWSEAQRRAAEAYGEIRDMPFPSVAPDLSADEVRRLAEAQAAELIAMAPAAVLCQGEFTYTYHMVRCLQQAGVLVLAACSERVSRETVDEQGASHRVSEFRFVQFRSYGE